MLSLILLLLFAFWCVHYVSCGIARMMEKYGSHGYDSHRDDVIDLKNKLDRNYEAILGLKAGVELLQEKSVIAVRRKR